MSDSDRYFRCTSLNLSVFLFTKDCQISGINPVKGAQKEFVFVKTDWLDEMVSLYKFGQADNEGLLVDVRKYEEARRVLMDRLND